MKKLEYKKFAIKTSNKKKVIKNLFNDVSAKYDLMNDIMSFGLHRLWKKDMLRFLRKEKPDLILDLAGGTGDISLLMTKIYNNIEIIIYDLSIKMILQSKKQFYSAANKIFYINGSAEEMALSNESVDLITLAFGIRNFSSIEKAVNECYRILKYGGKIYCLEFSPSSNLDLLPFYNIYTSKVIPNIGKFVAKNEDAYRYLVDSIKNFPHNIELKNIFKNSGFFCYNQRRYLGGIAYLNIFCKI